MPTIEERIADLEASNSALKSQLDSITTPSHAEVVNKMYALLTQWQAREDQLRDWLGGVGNGGPAADGKYPLTDSTGFTRLVACPDRIAADATKMSSLTLAASTQLTSTHGGKRIRMNNTSNANITFGNVPVDWNCIIQRVNTGTVSFVAASNVLQDQQMNRLRARWSSAAIWCDSIVNGVSQIVIQGSMLQA